MYTAARMGSYWNSTTNIRIAKLKMFAEPHRIESLQSWRIGIPNPFLLKPREAAHIRKHS
jgi:hypothetical protein